MKQAEANQTFSSKKVTLIDGNTLPELYLRRIKLSLNDTAYLVKRDGTYQPITWQHVHEQVGGLLKAYAKLGLKPGDSVCIMSNTRMEWNVIDLANLCYGLITVPIYQSNTSEDAAFIIEHCDAKLIMAEDNSTAGKVAAALNRLNRKTTLVSIEECSTVESATPLKVFAPPSANHQETLETISNTSKTITQDSIASIVYTSGTTGLPKGVTLTHRNFIYEVRGVVNEFRIGADDMTLSFLPVAHILGRIESLLPLFSGLRSAFAENINSIAQNMQEVHPTLLVSVPRIYEKVFAKIQTDVANQPKYKQELFSWAITTGREVARRRSSQEGIPIALMLKYQVADRLVFQKIRQKMGGNLRATISGGAPLSAELCEFFHACGILVMEGYGLTETSAAITCNTLHSYEFGTVGKPLTGMEIRIAEDGEVLCKGPMVFKSYYKNPEATLEAFTPDGWFRTGDIGEINQRGSLKITDRKKEIIVTSGGKNIAPQKLENMIKGLRYISNCLVLGDKQKYLSALLTLTEAEIQKWGRESGIAFEGYSDLLTKPETIKLIGDQIATMNQALAPYETIKKFRILPSDFTIETGELTPSMKVKRKVCIEKYRSYIDSMYT